MDAVAIWKAPLSIGPFEQPVRVPYGAQFLSAHAQDDVPCVWFRCDPTQAVREVRQILLLDTGHAVAAASLAHTQFLGTVLLRGSSYVLHVFVRDERGIVG